MPIPQAIFVLGGGQSREVFAAKLAHQYPGLEVWISSGSPHETATEIFNEAGISLSRLHLDYRATDTVTNFTTMVEVFRQRNIEHAYLVTSDYHMRRRKVILLREGSKMRFSSSGAKEILLEHCLMMTDNPKLLLGLSKMLTVNLKAPLIVHFL